MKETKASWQLDQAALLAGESAHALESERIKHTRKNNAVWCSSVGRDVVALKCVLEALRVSSASAAPAEESKEGSLLSTRVQLEAVQGSLSEALKDQVSTL